VLTRLDKGEEGKKGKRVKGKGKGNGEKQRFAKRSQFNCQKWRSPSRRLCRSALSPYPFPFSPFTLFTYSAFITICTGFSCEVSAFISGVAVTSRVRRMNIVETIRVIVQANPPSMP
jgi:hypothetical protein